MGRVNIEGGPFESCFVPNGVGGDVKVPLNEVACICVYMFAYSFDYKDTVLATVQK